MLSNFTRSASDWYDTLLPEYSSGGARLALHNTLSLVPHPFHSHYPSPTATGPDSDPRTSPAISSRETPSTPPRAQGPSQPGTTTYRYLRYFVSTHPHSLSIVYNSLLVRYIVLPPHPPSHRPATNFGFPSQVPAAIPSPTDLGYTGYRASCSILSRGQNLTIR